MRLFSWKDWWWVALFSLLVSFFYLHAMSKKREVYRELAGRFEKIQEEKELADKTKEALALRLASQNDPAWIELVLMRDLGVVPEGWLKVHFKGS